LHCHEGQGASVFSQQTIVWDHPIKDILHFSRFTTFDFARLNPECVAASLVGYPQQFFIASFLPLVIVILYALVGHTLPRIHQAMLDAPARAANAIGLLWQIFFIGLVMHGVQPFFTL